MKLTLLGARHTINDGYKILFTVSDITNLTSLSQTCILMACTLAFKIRAQFMHYTLLTHIQVESLN
jgi:hypothetical protein